MMRILLCMVIFAALISCSSAPRYTGNTETARNLQSNTGITVKTPSLLFKF